MKIDYRIQPARSQESMQEHPFHVWSLEPDGRIWCEFRRTEFGNHLRFPGMADFVISRGGHAATATPAPDLDEGTLEHLYLNQVVPLALSAQGHPVFHASAVELWRGAIAFLGFSGRGKSTLATAFALHGAPLITDDGLVLEKRSDHYVAHSSHPSVRLWDDSRQAVAGNQMEVARIACYTDKARLLGGGVLQASNGLQPLLRAYFLGEGKTETVDITPMTAAEATMELVRHSFLLDIDLKTRLASHFNEVSTIAASGICHRLDYPRDYQRLAEVRKAVMAHLMQPPMRDD